MTSVLASTDFDAWTGRVVRSMRRRHNDHCITILTYHSIAPEDTIFTAGYPLRHHPAEFERHVEYLAEHYKPIGLRELVSMLARGEQPRSAVVFTFDDGYADTLRRAMPILFRRRIPMTIFPVTSVIGNRDLLWQHKLAWLIAEGHERRVRSALRSARWQIEDQAEPLIDFVRRSFRPNLPDVLESILRRLGTSGPALAAEYKPYIDEQDIAAADPDLVDFGNHTDTHPVLSALTIGQQMAEISTAQRKIKDFTGRAPIALAYPFGLKPHYNDEAQRIAKNTGHRAALDMRRRPNVGLVDPFELSRRPAPIGSQAEFEQSVEDWPTNVQPPAAEVRP